MPGLYQTPSYYQKSQGLYNQAMQGYGAAAQQPEEPEKSAGGALQSAASMGMAGFSVGGGPGAAVGAGVGLGAYLLS